MDNNFVCKFCDVSECNYDFLDCEEYVHTLNEANKALKELYKYDAMLENKETACVIKKSIFQLNVSIQKLKKKIKI